MNNNDKYKETFSNICPSEESVERVIDMTRERKKSFNISAKQIVAVVMAFVIMIGGGFAVNRVTHKNDDFVVMVAYASSGEFQTIGSQDNQTLFYALYVAPIDDEAKQNEVLKRYYADSNKVHEEAEKLSDDGSGTSISDGTLDCFNEKLNKDTVNVHIICAGNIALSLDDYSNVKSFKVENDCPYGWLHFEDSQMYDRMEKQAETDEEYDFTYEETLDWYNIGNEFTLTGDQLRESQESGRFSSGTKHEVNKGYFLEWQPSDKLRETLADDPNFDLTQIKDTITFTVEFNDGTVKTASANLCFDSDGYMHFE